MFSNYLFFSNKTALHFAAENGNLEILKILLNGKDIDINLKAIFKNII